MYRTEDMPPPYNVRVWLAWPGWLGEGARVMGADGPGTSGERWLTWQDGRPQILPPASARDAKGKVRAGHERPVLWAPLYPEKWRAALPEPVKAITEGRMWSAHQSFDAVAAAEEMEADRIQARGTDSRSEQAEARNRQWWRDAALITYSQPGSITRKEAEGRVMRAIAGDPFARWGDGTGFDAPWLPIWGMTLEEIQAEAERDTTVLRDVVMTFNLLPQDHRDYVTAMGWFASTLRRRARSEGLVWGHPILLLAADDRAFSWREMGDKLRVSRQAAAEQYRAAIEDIWIIANNFAHAGRARRDAALADVQARVRRHRGSHE